jgi:hypothetical protein
MSKSLLKIMIDSRLKKNVESLNSYKNGICSVRFKEFWFNTVNDIQEFMHNQASERYFDKFLRKGYFDYTNEYGEILRYEISKVYKGQIEVKEEYVI